MDKYSIKSLNKKKAWAYAVLEAAKKEDLSRLPEKGFDCNWTGFWHSANFDCEAIIKLNYIGNILGLIHFAAYPYPCDDYPEYLEILHLECIPRTYSSFNPVGLWLIWYAVMIGNVLCKGQPDETLIRLDSLEKAIPYYRGKVMMEEIGWTTIAPGEDGYAFRFTKKQAKQFCTRIERKYGQPTFIP